MLQKEQLLSPVTRKEVEQARKDLPIDKSPGIDGYNAEFFKTYWSVIGEEVITGIIQFFENGKLLKGVNTTTITLFLKVSSPSYEKEYRPIACCATLYKLIAKILTARPKTVVDFLVSSIQSAFIEGRSILELMVG